MQQRGILRVVSSQVVKRDSPHFIVGCYTVSNLHRSRCTIWPSQDNQKSFKMAIMEPIIGTILQYHECLSRCCPHISKKGGRQVLENADGITARGRLRRGISTCGIQYHIHSWLLGFSDPSCFSDSLDIEPRSTTLRHRGVMLTKQE